MDGDAASSSATTSSAVNKRGALRLLDEDGRYQRTAAEGDRKTPFLIELAQLLAATEAVETNTETEADLAYLPP